MKTAKVDFDGRFLSMPGPEQIERLSIKSTYPWDNFSESLFAQLGTMHLVAPYLPKNIRTNFYITKDIRELMGGMYTSESKIAPAFIMSGNNYEYTPPRFNKFQEKSCYRLFRRKRLNVEFVVGIGKIWR
ncbi:MAG: hypothetical protein Q8R55_04565 [Candidatus Taylorbacteria bacterium]|nr:hypothetical protein [Candidatus Taylorbacteria bacterium]